MIHYCPECAAFNFYDPQSGAAPWALECSTCGAVARQHPHPPPPGARPAAPPVSEPEVRADGSRVHTVEAVGFSEVIVSTGNAATVTEEPKPPKPARRPRAPRKPAG